MLKRPDPIAQALSLHVVALIDGDAELDELFCNPSPTFPAIATLPTWKAKYGGQIVGLQARVSDVGCKDSLSSLGCHDAFPQMQRSESFPAAGTLLCGLGELS